MSCGVDPYCLASKGFCMSTPRITWSANERAQFTNTLASYLKANQQTVDHVTRPGWFAFYMQQAQVFFPEDRKRRIFAPSVIPWLLPALRVAMGEQLPKPASVEEYVSQHLQEVLAVLAKTHVVVPKTECVIQPISRGHTSRVKQLRVLIAGCLPAQAAELSAEFGQEFDLRFVNSTDYKAKAASTDADYAIGLTSFISHSIDGNLRATYKARYTRVVGAVCAVKRQLEQLKQFGKSKETA